eukprot:CAMPEP_0172326064 /NCGR_PEP_ID=MMETSP1058-20130122/55483_1 /TAXON_ID=83371 /ORGANISM="Detonula confervacea, Strain CCMP 353" /LENGTH=441 /DNA_ID=CAMNT_0013042759 /DNA_START=119 /DNA_END=1441 /DNA_ORIENTATION=+
MMKGISVDADAGWTPLYLSTLAGMSTCLGALIVFCHPIEEEDDDEERSELVDGSPSRLRKRRSGRRKVSPSTMAFSLALAGSVMVTVSVVSIGPECLAASSMPQNAQNTDLDTENSFFIFGITLMPIFSWVFLHRLLSFGAGSLLYFLMSKYAFPEPEELLATHFDSVQRNSSPRSSLSSDKSSDDEYDNECTSTNSPTSKELTTLPDKTTGINLNNSLQRRGTGTEDIEMATSLSNGRGKRKGLFRRPPADRTQCCSNPFTSCMTSLRVFTRGSDLDTPEARRANRVAMLLFFSLLIHNFPEGLAVAASALESDQLGMTVTIGVMIHNIPEGIAIAIPCLKARPDSPWLCFILASVSGLAEPAGAFVSLVLLRGVERRQGGVEEGEEIGGEGMLENVLAFVAGIMITVSFLELFPEAKHHAENSGMKAYYAGLVAGFVVM